MIKERFYLYVTLFDRVKEYRIFARKYTYHAIYDLDSAYLLVDGSSVSNASSKSHEVALLSSGPASCNVRKPACNESVFANCSFSLS